jgi:hypothetical protein
MIFGYADRRLMVPELGERESASLMWVLCRTQAGGCYSGRGEVWVITDFTVNGSWKTDGCRVLWEDET